MFYESTLRFRSKKSAISLIFRFSLRLRRSSWSNRPRSHFHPKRSFFIAESLDWTSRVDATCRIPAVPVPQHTSTSRDPYKRVALRCNLKKTSAIAIESRRILAKLNSFNNSSRSWHQPSQTKLNHEDLRSGRCQYAAAGRAINRFHYGHCSSSCFSGNLS